MNPGDLVIWLWEPRGGYCQVQHVLAEVVKVGPKRVEIEVEKIHTLGVRIKERKFVKAEKLRPRKTLEDR